MSYDAGELSSSLDSQLRKHRLKHIDLYCEKAV